MSLVRAAENIYFSATKNELCQPLPRNGRPSSRPNRGKAGLFFTRRRKPIRNDNGLQGHDQKHWKRNRNSGYKWTV